MQGTRTGGQEAPRDGEGGTGARQGLWRNAVAGLSGGFVSSIMIHPLDVVNTRVQVADGRLSHLPVYRSTWDGLRSIARHEGIRQLYAGLYPNLVGSTMSWGFYFYGYNALRDLASKARPPPCRAPRVATHARARLRRRPRTEMGAG